MPFSLFLALRYLRPKRSLVSVVTLLSVLGVTLGVMVLVIVLSVMSGFDQMWSEKILGFNAHVTITKWGEIEDSEQLCEELSAVESVTGAAPFIQGLVFVNVGERIFTPLLRGIDPELEKTISQVPKHMVEGTFDVEEDQVILGADLARRLNVYIGDSLLVYSSDTFTTPDRIRLPEELEVVGIFEIGMYDFDMGYIMTTLSTARDLQGMESGVNGVQVMSNRPDPEDAELVAGMIRAKLGRDYNVKTWMEMNRQMFAALRVEKNMMSFLLFFIVLVAAFGITNTLITVTVQKTHEIGLLKSLGFPPLSIMNVFLWQGWVAGILGNFFGVGLGVLVLHYRNAIMSWTSKSFGWELLPKELYHLSEIPAQTRWDDVCLIVLMVMVFCTVAGAVPAFRAARLDAARALRYE